MAHRPDPCLVSSILQTPFRTLGDRLIQIAGCRHTLDGGGCRFEVLNAIGLGFCAPTYSRPECAIEHARPLVIQKRRRKGRLKMK